MRPATRLLLLAAFCLALAAVAASSHAGLLEPETAPPANDLFERAQPLDSSNSVIVEGNSEDATKEREPRREPDHAGDPGGASVWYGWIAPASGPVSINVCDAEFDTLLAVYTGKFLDELGAVASNNNSCGSGSAVTFFAAEDELYWIAVDGVLKTTAASGRFVLSLTQRPQNDDFADATALSGATPTGGGTSENATKEPGEPNHAGQPGGASVWYRWTAPTSGLVSIDSCDSSFDTLLGVYTGPSVGSLTQVAGSDNGCGLQGAVTLSVSAGQTYQIAVDRKGAQNGSVSLRIGSPPANDNLAAAQLMSGSSATATGSTIGATKQTAEPDHAGEPGGASVWYRWTAPSTGLFAFDTCGSDFDTLLAVYTGASMVALDGRASADDGCGTRSRLSFKATSGTTYRIAVDGAGEQGAVSLRLRPVAANDDISARGFLSGPATSTAASNVGASEEAFEPNHAGNRGGASIWYRWQAPNHGLVSIDTCGSDFDTLLGVYTETTPFGFPAVSDLVETASNDNGCGARSKVVFMAESTIMYWIAVDGRDSGSGPAEGNVVLRVSMPPNDAFADAQTITGNSARVTASNDDATKEAGEPNHAGNPGGSSLWYRWTAPVSARAVFDTCDTNINTLLAVYTGSTVGSLTPVASNDDACNTNRSRVVFNATMGTTYWIAVDGFDAGSGPAQSTSIVLDLALAPANDDFADSQLLSGLPASSTGTNMGATKETGEPNHAGNTGGSSVWYRWVSTLTGRVAVDTCDSGSATLLAVYTGSAVNALTPVASNTRCVVGFNVTIGTTYRIAVDGPAFGNGGANEGAVQLRIAAAPSNDNFSSAQVLSGATPAVTGNNRGATKEAGEPNHASTITGASVWYRWTAPSSGVVYANTCGNEPFAARVDVYTGAAVNALTDVGTSVNRCGQWIGRFTAVAGTTYNIVVDGADVGDGTGPGMGGFDLRLELPVSNDSFAARTTLTGTTLSAAGSTIGASTEVGEPNHADNNGGASVWYTWTAPATGQFTLDTCENDFDTLLAVYTGAAVNLLSPLVSSDNGPCGNQGSLLTFSALASVTYVIAIDGRDFGAGSVDQGHFVLRLSPAVIAPPTPPANNNFAAAQTLSGGRATVGGSNVDATKESGEPAHAGNAGGASVWYRWTATQTGRVAIDTCGSGFDTLLAVYTGSAVNALGSPVASNNDSCGTRSKVAFKATDGTTYRIVVDGAGAAQGTIQLRLRMPPNDDFADAEPISGSTATVSGTNLGATVESGEPLHKNWFTQANEASVWYRWTAPAAGRFVFDSCGSDFHTALSVYTGSSVNTLTRVGDTGVGRSVFACGDRSIVALNAVAGTTYQIAVDGFSIGGEPPARGHIKLRLGPPAPNDAFAAAELLSGDDALVLGTNAGATKEAGEPFHWSEGGSSVWYRWTAPRSGRATIDTCGSDFFADLAVYTGSMVSALALVAQNGSSCGELNQQSRVSFAVTAGTTYSVAVDGRCCSDAQARQGEIELALKLRPANDDFADAQTLTGGTTTASGANLNGSKEAGEPNHAGNAGGASVWYRWTAPASGRVGIDTCGPGLDTVLAVYTGAAVGSLTSVASNDDSCGSQSRLSFQATSGTEYRIAVDGRGGAQGSFTLSLDAEPPQTTIDTGTTGPTSNASPSFSFSSSEANSTFECRLDAAAFGPCVTPHAYLSLADGAHTFEVRAIDPAGNTDPTPASRSFTVDTAAPDTTIDSGPSGTTNASPSFAFSSSQAGSTFECRLDAAAFALCTSPRAYSGLASGAHTFEVRAIDPAGNVDPSPASRSFTVDTTGAVATIESGPSGTVTSTSAAFEFSAEAGATFECRLDPGSYASCSSPKTYTGLTDGSYTFRVRATDAVGNTGAEVTRTWTVDATAPTVAIDSGPSGTVGSADAAFVFSADQDATFECRLDAGSYAGCSSPKTYTGLAEGEHTFRVRATDTAGNPGAEVTRTWTVDTIGPTVTILTGPSGTLAEFMATFTFSSEPGATFECTITFPLSPNPFHPCTSPATYFVGDVINTFHVRATDAAGNTGPEVTRTWTVDTRAPVTIDSAPSGTTNQKTATIAFSAEPGATFECRLDSSAPGDLEPCTSPKTYTNLADGQHLFEVYATDQLGNREGNGAFWTVDTVAPGTTIGSGPSGTVGSADATFEFSAEAGATFECRLDAAAFASCASPVAHTGLADGSHTFGVRATDAAGNTGAETTRTWTVDATAPAVTIDSGPSGSVQQANATFTFSSEAGATFECRLDDGDFASCSSPQGYTVAGGSHTFRVRATDAVGNQGTEVTRTWIRDLIAPVVTIDSGPSGTVATTSATFVFSSEPGVGFECRRDLAAYEECTSPKTYTGLAEGSHTFRVRATDAVGNTGLDATRTWTVQPVSHTLTVSKAGNGAGAVTSSPGIDCGADCSESYGEGTLVTLTATPGVNSTFTGWSGACSGSAGCVVTMDAAKTVTAAFSLVSRALTVSKSGTGGGTVTGTGVDCGADCSQGYDHGTSVSLSATPASNSSFTGWSGACTGTGSCDITMDAAKSVTATFALLPPVTRPTVQLAVGKQKLGTVLSRGFKLTLTSNRAGAAKVELVISKALAKKLGLGKTLVIGSVKRAVAAGQVTITVKLIGKAKKALKKAASVTFKVKSSVTDGVPLTGTATKSVTLRR